MDTALTDLVKLVLQNNGYLVLSKEAVMMFRSAVREDLRSGDVHRPGKLVVVWNVHYHNATIVPTPADLPVSNFTFVPTGLQVAFTNTSSGETSRDWDFGDGSSHSTSENPVHDYSIAGSYYVTLVSTNATGSDAITKIVTVTT
jgi:PKD repeat protein